MTTKPRRKHSRRTHSEALAEWGGGDVIAKRQVANGELDCFSWPNCPCAAKIEHWNELLPIHGLSERKFEQLRREMIVTFACMARSPICDKSDWAREQMQQPIFAVAMGKMG
jgi:hypothetical protein